jgi:uroporphyrinogen-III synthase
MSAGRALDARRVVVTRAEAQSARLLEALRAEGAVPIAAPAIRVLPPDDPGPLQAAVADLAQFDWLVCTSTNAVRAVAAALSDAHGAAAWPESLRAAAVGPTTAHALRSEGIAVAFTPSAAVAEAMARELPIVAGARVLWPHGDLADGSLGEALSARGAVVTAPVAYRTVADVALLGIVDAVRDGRVDAITFTSASTVRHVVEGLTAAGVDLARPGRAPRPLVVCIGPVSAAAARECGLIVDAIADPHDDSGMITALTQAFAARAAAA